MKLLLLLGTLALPVTMARAQDEPRLLASLVPARATTTRAFAPRGWVVEKMARGDLNRDRVLDAAIVLIEDKPAKDKDGYATPRSRALVVAVKDKAGWKRVGFSNELLLGTDGGGAFFGVMPAPVEVSIRRGVLVVGMEFGSREVEETTHRFRLQPPRGVMLIGFDSNVRDRAVGSVHIESANFLTGEKRITDIPPGKEKGTTKTTRVSKVLRALESLRESERYGNGE